MEYDDARKKFLAFAEMNKGVPVSETRVVVREIGWVFYYQSQLFFNTADALDGLMGNYPIFVSKKGDVLMVHPLEDIEDFLTNYTE